MNLKTFAVLTVVACSAMAALADAHAYLCQLTAIGDRRLVTIAGEKASFTSDVAIELQPTNAPAGTYGIRCRVVYADPGMPIPGDLVEQFEHAEKTGALLEGWLREFVASEYAGAEFQNLVVRYYQGDVAKDLDFMFKRYVGERLAELEDEGEGLRMDVIMVEVAAASDLRKWLLDTYIGDRSKRNVE